MQVRKPDHGAAAGLACLVIEDRSRITELLETLGAGPVHRARTESAAVDVLSRREPEIDIVVSDLDLPGVGGTTLIRHLSADRRRAGLIVVSVLPVSVVGAVGTIARIHGVEFLAAISKPVTARDLEDALARRRR